MNLSMDVRVLAVSRYDIPNENGKPPVRGTKIKYLGEKRQADNYRGFDVMEINGPYELFERFNFDQLPGIYHIDLSQKMSNKKPTLIAKGAAFSKPSP